MDMLSIAALGAAITYLMEALKNAALKPLADRYHLTAESYAAVCMITAYLLSLAALWLFARDANVLAEFKLFPTANPAAAFFVTAAFVALWNEGLHQVYDRLRGEPPAVIVAVNAPPASPLADGSRG